MYREKDLARDSVFKRHRMGLELNLLSREHCSAALASASEGNETNLKRFRVKEANFRMLCSNKREKEEEEEEEEESRRLFIEGKGRYILPGVANIAAYCERWRAGGNAGEDGNHFLGRCIARQVAKNESVLLGNLHQRFESNPFLRHRHKLKQT